MAACGPTPYTWLDGSPRSHLDPAELPADAAPCAGSPFLGQPFATKRTRTVTSTCLVDFEVGPTFDSFMGLKLFLEDHLGRKVDLVTPDALKPRMRPVVEREAVDVA